jgi:2-polyprenyl-3-methyl-5-hydroxy-6-metoxy-1,4-benzoquinol methylase
MDELARVRCSTCLGAGKPLSWSTRWRLSRCTQCGVVYPASWREQLGDATFHAGNEDYYAGLPKQAPSELTSRRITSLLDDLGGGIPGRRLLDVGCGRGELVEVALERGWQARGIDLAAAAIEHCRARALPCTRSDFFDGALSEGRFDLIVMSEFIEHVPQGQRFLERARELLAPGGVVYATTPNFDSLGRRVFGDDWNGFCEGHVALHTGASLCRLGARAGLRTVRVETANLSPLALQRLFLPRSAEAVGDCEEPFGREAQQADMQALRRRIYGSRLLTSAKGAVDVWVRASRLGETLKIRLTR